MPLMPAQPQANTPPVTTAPPIRYDFEFGPEEFHVPLDGIDPNSRNPRKVQSNREGMIDYAKSRVASARSQTWGDPIWIYKHHDPRGKYEWEILNGMGRFLSAVDAGWSTINAKEFLGSTEDAEFIRGLGNVWSRELTTYQLAAWVVEITRTQKLKQEAVREKMIALGYREISQSYLSILIGCYVGLIDPWREHWRTCEKPGVNVLFKIKQLNPADQEHALETFRLTGRAKLPAQRNKRKKPTDPFAFVKAQVVKREPSAYILRARGLLNPEVLARLTAREQSLLSAMLESTFGSEHALGAYLGLKSK